jgi:hypothetical protein
LEDMHIITNPLLNEDRKERSKKTEDEGHEPKDIYTDVRRRWIEHRERRWWSGRDGNLWGDGGELDRDLGEDSRMLSKVIHRFICGARLQVLFAIDYESRESSRK